MSFYITITDVNNKIIEEDIIVTSYSFSSQLFMISDSFSINLLDNNKYNTTNWYQLLFYINNKIAFTGIIQSIERAYDKESRRVIISGKDRSSILVRSYCRSFPDYKNVSRETIVKDVIKQTSFEAQLLSDFSQLEYDPYYSNSEVDEYNNSIKNAIKNNNAQSYAKASNTIFYDQDFKNSTLKESFKINKGDTVWSVINRVVADGGFQIQYNSNGSLYIGNLQKKRLNEGAFFIDSTVAIKRGAERIDVSNQYSDYLIYKVAERLSSTGQPYSTAVATDSQITEKSFYVGEINTGSAKEMAIKTREDRRQEGYMLEYEIGSHVQNGEFFDINRYIYVSDDYFNINDNFVIFGRTFAYNQDAGQTTTLTIGRDRNYDLNS